MTGSREKIEDIVVVPKKSELMLNQRQLEDYRQFRKQMIKWIVNLGKNPKRAEGYAYDTARQRCYKIDQFYRWIWQQQDGYTLNATTELADQYSKELAYRETSQSDKAAVQKAMTTLFKYLRVEKNRDLDWDPDIQFTNGGSNTHQIRDFLTDAERRKIKQAVLEYGSIPHYNSVSPEERDRWKSYLAQRFEKRKSEVYKSDWQKANGWKFPSITYVLYESAARPGELLSASLGDFTANGKGDFIFLEGAKDTPDRTNQLVRSGRTLREWIAQHPFGGETGDIQDSSVPLWVKTQQHACQNCGKIPQFHNDNCNYEPDPADPLKDAAYRRRFKNACEKADIPENKRRPYNLRHTRLTEVATFMSYEQLNKFAGWKPGSDRAKVYVHLNNDDVNQSIRDEYGLKTGKEENQEITCPFCGTENQNQHSECRSCGRPLTLEQEKEVDEKQDVIERLQELEEKGVLEKLQKLDRLEE